MIAIIDYGVGNLFSLRSSLSFLGLENSITGDAQEVKRADKIILPGVGAFRDAIEKLNNSGLVETIKEEAANGKPLLGICLGMQLLFEKSYEYGEHEGLALLPGEICAIKDTLRDPNLKVPHMGWNSLEIKRAANPLIRSVANGAYVYYVHSYCAKTSAEHLVATSPYGIDIAGIVCKDNICGTQFHPEKSGAVGLKILKNFGGL